ncbi:hypothetical protein AMR41_20175 [Hapalosiphon sp. MRB220]|nr:hypothetical protein AMR41_20175 [Hapalosiphon sp. MRB220]
MYDAAQIMVKGIEEQGNNPTRQGLYNILNDGFSIKGATGTVKFDDQRDRVPEKNKIGVLV